MKHATFDDMYIVEHEGKLFFLVKQGNRMLGIRLHKLRGGGLKSKEKKQRRKNNDEDASTNYKYNEALGLGYSKEFIEKNEAEEVDILGGGYFVAFCWGGTDNGNFVHENDADNFTLEDIDFDQVSVILACVAYSLLWAQFSTEI